MTKSIILVGVGGQGTILAAKLLTVALMDAGYDVKMSEIHGMSQRGGSVSSQVRYGKEVHSPVIEEGGADILVAFEKMEAMRWISYLNPKGKVLVNNWEIKSMPIVTGKVDYPQGIIEELSAKVPTTAIDAAKLATELGNSKVMNVILLGATVKSMGLDTLDWERIIKENVKPALAELNIKALRLGMAQV